MVRGAHLVINCALSPPLWLESCPPSPLWCGGWVLDLCIFLEKIKKNRQKIEEKINFFTEKLIFALKQSLLRQKSKKKKLEFFIIDLRPTSEKMGFLWEGLGNRPFHMDG